MVEHTRTPSSAGGGRTWCVHPFICDYKTINYKLGTHFLFVYSSSRSKLTIIAKCKWNFTLGWRQICETLYDSTKILSNDCIETVIRIQFPVRPPSTFLILNKHKVSTYIRCAFSKSWNDELLWCVATPWPAIALLPCWYCWCWYWLLLPLLWLIRGGKLANSIPSLDGKLPAYRCRYGFGKNCWLCWSCCWSCCRLSCCWVGEKRPVVVEAEEFGASR